MASDLPSIMAELVESPWRGVAVAAAMASGFFLVVCGFMAVMPTWKFRVPWRTGFPIIALGFVFFWRGWSIARTGVVAWSGLVVLVSVALVTFVVLVEMIVQANRKAATEAAEASAVDQVADAIAAPVPPGYTGDDALAAQDRMHNANGGPG